MKTEHTLRHLLLRHFKDFEATVELVPDRVEFYNSEKRPMGTLKSIAMMAVLFLRRKKILNADGVSIRLRVAHE